MQRLAARREHQNMQSSRDQADRRHSLLTVIPTLVLGHPRRFPLEFIRELEAESSPQTVPLAFRGIEPDDSIYRIHDISAALNLSMVGDTPRAGQPNIDRVLARFRGDRVVGLRPDSFR